MELEMEQEQEQGHSGQEDEIGMRMDWEHKCTTQETKHKERRLDQGGHWNRGEQHKDKSSECQAGEMAQETWRRKPQIWYAHPPRN